MPQSFSKVAIHIVFSNKNRESFIDEAIENELFAYLGGMCKVFECVPIIVGGHQDHVHILCYISRKIARIGGPNYEISRRSKTSFFKMDERKR
jgi:putative transposase